MDEGYQYRQFYTLSVPDDKDLWIFSKICIRQQIIRSENRLIRGNIQKNNSILCSFRKT